MADQLQMIWPEARVAHRLEWQASDGYSLRTFRAGDEDAYLSLMRSAGFDTWNQDTLGAVLKNAIPGGIMFAEHMASSTIVATAMGWYRPSALFDTAYEMGWVAADPAHRGKGLGRVVVAAITQALLEHGARRIYLLTDDWRLPAIKGYLKVGYVPLYHKPEMRTRWQETFLKLDLKMEEYAGVDYDMLPPPHPAR